MPTASVFVPTQRPGVHKKKQELLLLRKSLPGDCTGGRGREASEPLWARLDANYGDTDRIGGSNSKPTPTRSDWPEWPRRRGNDRGWMAGKRSEERGATERTKREEKEEEERDCENRNAPF